MVTYNKEDIYMITLEGIEQGLFIGISNKHYDELYKYYGYLKALDNTNNVQKSNEDNGKINRLQKELEQEKAYCKFWKELTLNLKSSFEGLINKIEEGDINIDKSN